MMKKLFSALWICFLIGFTNIDAGGHLTDVSWSSVRSHPDIKRRQNPKMESILNDLVEAFQRKDSERAKQLGKMLSVSPEGDSVTVVLVLYSDVDDVVIEKIEELGAKVQTSAMNLIQASVPTPLLDTLSSQPYIRYIRTPWVLYPNVIRSEGVGVIGADEYHRAGIRGRDVKVGILDVGFYRYETFLGTELPDTVVIRSFRYDGDITGRGLTHGTAVAEIVHDVAPDAELYLVNSEYDVEWINAVDWLIAEGVDIISSSVGFLMGPGDGRGSINDAVNEARENGILFVQGAGNYAQRHYEGTFTDVDDDRRHEFRADEGLTLYARGGSTVTVYLMWDDWGDDPAVGTSEQDYDLYLFDSDDNLIGYSERVQDGYEFPLEYITYNVWYSGYYDLMVTKYKTTRDCLLEVYSAYHDFLEEERVPQSSLGIPADARGALAVGATNYRDDTLEPFSSQGPTNDGRVKPDLVAPDRVSTVYRRIYGTSASTVHVSGAAALLLSQDPDLTADQLQSKLEESAIDLDVPGKDNLYGSGRINLPVEDIWPVIAPTALGWSDSSRTVSIVSGDWNNHPNPHFEWKGAVDISGVEGYSVAFTADSTDALSRVVAQRDTTYTVTTNLISGITYYLRVSAQDSLGNWSPAATLFTYRYDSIPPTPTVVYPNGGETLAPGEQDTIRWEATDDVGVKSISLYYTTDGGMSYTLIDTLESNDGAFIWSVPTILSPFCKVKVVVSDSAGNAGYDISNFPFSIEFVDTAVPTVRVISPNGDEVWSIGDVDTIRWAASDNVGVERIALWYSINNGVEWVLIDSLGVDPAASSYPWVVPSTPSFLCLVKVAARDSVGNGSSDVSNSTFIIADRTPPTATVVSPNGGESWATGDQDTIRWAVRDNVGVTSVSIYYSTDSGATWLLISEGEPNDSTYVWTIPDTPSENCRVKVVAYDAAGNAGADSSDEDFAIVDQTPPIVVVIAPNGGEKWVAGEQNTVYSVVTDNVGVNSVDIYYSTDSGETWLLVSEGEPFDSTYTALRSTYQWSIPDTPSENCRVKVVAYDAAGNAGADSSDEDFLIVDQTPPTATLITPNGGERLEIGQPYDITWSASDNVDVTNIALYCSIDAGLSFFPIDTVETDDGLFTWIVPNTPSTAAKVKIAASDAGGNASSDTSDANFTISDQTGPSNPTTALGWSDSSRTVSLVSGSWYNYPNPHFEWKGATDISGVAGYSVAFTTDSSDTLSTTVTQKDTTYTVTTGLVSGTAYYLRLRARDNPRNWSLATTLFTYKYDSLPPVASLIYPNGGEILEAGAQDTIRWEATDDVGAKSISLYYTTDGGMSYTLIDTLESNDGAFIWSVPTILSPLCKVKVAASDSAGNMGYDISNSLFSIVDTTPPTVRVVSPNGDEVWSVGDVDTIRWAASDNVGVERVSLWYSINAGVEWMLIDSLGVDPAASSYPWIVPSNPSFSCLVKVTTRDLAGNESSDMSNSTFVIVISGDFNFDGVVDLMDFLLFAEAFGTTGASPDWYPIFDLDNSGDVGLSDFFIFVEHFGERAGVTK